MLTPELLRPKSQNIYKTTLLPEKGISSAAGVLMKNGHGVGSRHVLHGQRALVCMKHVGLNVAADAFVNSAITGVNGGLVVLVADDPSMHSSQNEQDSRFYGKFALMPILEPSSQQEAYDMMGYAYNLSEELKLPILMRVTTRMAHSRAVVKTASVREPNEINNNADPSNFIYCR